MRNTHARCSYCNPSTLLTLVQVSAESLMPRCIILVDMSPQNARESVLRQDHSSCRHIAVGLGNMWRRGKGAKRLFSRGRLALERRKQ